MRQPSQTYYDDNSSSYVSEDQQENQYTSYDDDSAIRFGGAFAPGSAESSSSIGRNVASTIRERAYLAAHRRMHPN